MKRWTRQPTGMWVFAQAQGFRNRQRQLILMRTMRLRAEVRAMADAAREKVYDPR